MHMLYTLLHCIKINFQSFVEWFLNFILFFYFTLLPYENISIKADEHFLALIVRIHI